MAEHDWRIPPAALETTSVAVDMHALGLAARFHAVSGCVYRSLAALPGPARPGLERLRLDRDRALQHHIRVLADLARLVPVLTQLGVPWVVVKGPVLAETIYTHADLRTYTDLDVVVPGRALAEVLEVLEADGATVVDRNWRLLHRHVLGAVHVRLNFGTLADVHWHLLHSASERESFRIPVAELFERACTVSLGGLAVRTLCPEDTLLHLGLHGCRAGANRLVWLKDIERAIVALSLDWDEVVARARAWRVPLALALVLQRARAVLGAPVPDGLVAALAPSRSWRAFLAVTDRLSPTERSRGQRSLARMLARSTGPTVSGSVGQFSRHLLIGLRNPLDRTPSATDNDPDSPGSLLFPTGGVPDRQAYLGVVADEPMGVPTISGGKFSLGPASRHRL